MGALPKNIASLPSGQGSLSSAKKSSQKDKLPSELAFLVLAVIIVIAVVCAYRFGYFGKIKKFFIKKKESALDSDLPAGGDNS